MTKSAVTTLFTCIYMGISLPSYAQTSLNPEQIFNEAMEMRNSGEIIGSIQTFESLLNQQPGLNRVRLELAVAYHMLKRFEDARDQLYKVLNDPTTPDNVRLTITSYLAQLGADEKVAKQRTTDSVYVAIGAFTDSNVNIAPSDIIQLLPGTAEKDATGSTILLNYSHKSRSLKPLIESNNPVNFEWNSALTAYSKIHSGDENDFNLHLLSVKTGPQLKSDKNWSAEFNFKLTKIYFDGNPYADHLALNPKFSLQFADNLNVTFENSTTIREFSNTADSGLDGISKLYDISISKIFEPKTFGIEGGARYHSNGAQDGHLNSSGPEIYLSGYSQPWQNGRIFLNLSSRDYEYSNSEFNVTGAGNTLIRDETETNATLGASHGFTEGSLKSWSINGQLSYTENESNISFYNYDRTIFEINLSHIF
ncbi:MAG: surface lipoprotein assembly modifier [Gammaproteobacteria bacterium]|nr:surface lipoprotein assembly modifier [Gammaproteobacteria bacterium]MDH5736556.1 surface lipoprotein assembly modifier [Gammaproteobacteria bacterium]